jgi:NAD(P)-dependent dehydrogenase (short-subunit alcohol dehydrogenase family)
LTPKDVNLIGVECDVGLETSVQQAFSEVKDTFGRLDAVVASAGECTTEQLTWLHFSPILQALSKTILLLSKVISLYPSSLTDAHIKLPRRSY